MDSLERLLKGNKHYAKGEITAKNAKEKREETLTAQNPYAIVVTCSDSRVVPEHIFNTNLGEIFVIRTAGNVVDGIALGSIEYAAAHLRVPLLVVLGHERCGAVSAAYEGHAEGNIATILEKIKPIIEKVKKGVDKEKEIEEAIDLNVDAVIEEIRKKSSIISSLEKDGKLNIVGMKYKLTDGTVSML